MADRAPPRWVRRLLGSLTLLYPPGFRRSVGRDLAELLVDQARDAARAGRTRLLWFCAASVLVALRDAALEWAGTVADRRDEGRVGMSSNGGGGGMMERLVQDLRHSVRGLLRRPGYAAAAVLTLALGIGANTAMFSVLNGVLLRPLPYPAPDRLVRIYQSSPTRDVTLGRVSVPDFRDWEAGAETVRHMGIHNNINSDLIYTAADGALSVQTVYVTAGFWQTLATPPRLGRVPRIDEEVGDNRVVVVSHRFWVTHLGGDPEAVGRTIALSDIPYVVVGVMPSDFVYPTPDTDIWAFLSTIPPSSTPYQLRGLRLLEVVGRLEAGETVESAQAELSAIASALENEHPDSNEGYDRIAVRPLHDIVVGDSDRSLAMLMAAVLFILTIACMNIANLALAKGLRRSGELAVRAALGAGRGRQLSLLLTESLVIATVGGALGILLAVEGTQVFVRASAGLLPRVEAIELDGSVLLFTLGISVLAGIAFGLAPARAALRADLVSDLRSGGRGATGGDRRLRDALVLGQVAGSVVLLIGAGLLLRSLWSLQRVDPGYEAEGLTVAALTFPGTRYSEREEYSAVADRTLEAFRAIPGVQGAAYVRFFPLRGSGEEWGWAPAGTPADAEDVEREIAFALQVSPGFFTVLGAEILDGRDITEADDPGPPVIVVNETLARQVAPDGRAVGTSINVGGTDVEIVGVVADVKSVSLQEPAPPSMYLPQRLAPRRGMAFVVRTFAADMDVRRALREAIASVDPDQPFSELATADEILGSQAAESRFFSMMLAAFAALALTLSALGIYGVVSFGVAQRRQEIGIRLAMGAAGREVRRLVIRQGMTPVVLGAAVGVATSLALGGVVQGFLFGVRASDPWAYAAALAALTAVGLAACYLPARAASRTPPVEVLTAE